MTDARRDPALDDEPDLDEAVRADGDTDLDETREDDDEQPEDGSEDAQGQDDVDFETFMDEEGEDEGERPGWARRRWSSAALVVAALVGAVAVALATWSWPDTGVSGDRIAEVELVGLSSTVGDAVATLSDVDGRRMLRIDAGRLPDVADGYAQVWLLDQSLERYVAVGVVDAESTEIFLPGTLDLRTYPIIEVSQEPYDGDPAHSGRTLWRGQLPQD